LIKVGIWKNPHPPQLGGPLEIPSQRGVSKAKIFNGKYEPKLEFKEGLKDEGSNLKILHGGYELSFWNYTNI